MDCKLKMGDLLYRSKDFVEHAGVYLGNNLVFHISPDNGAEAISLEEYAAGSEIKVVHTNFENKQVLEKRLEEILQSRDSYMVTSNNCEHIANYLIYGRSKSPQLQAALCGALLGMLLGRNASASRFVIYTLLGAAGACLLSNQFRHYDQRISPNNVIA